MSTGRKTIEEKQTILLESMHLLGKVFLYFICKYFIMWDVQSHSITGRSRNDLKSGYFSRTKNTVFFAQIIVLK